MNENELKTLTQVAKELDLDRSALYRRLNSEPLLSKLKPYTKTVNNTLYYSDEGIDVFKNSPEYEKMKRIAEKKKNNTSADSESESLVQTLQDSIEFLKEQLAIKDEQLRIKDEQTKEQIAEKNTELDRISQQLSVKDNQLAIKDGQITKLTEALTNAQEVQKETMLALQAAEALHNNTLTQIAESTKKKRHFFPFRRKNDEIIDVESKEKKE